MFKVNVSILRSVQFCLNLEISTQLFSIYVLSSVDVKTCKLEQFGFETKIFCLCIEDFFRISNNIDTCENLKQKNIFDTYINLIENSIHYKKSVHCLDQGKFLKKY